ncbi:MAG TPA: glycosyl hydrolase family 28 protein [Candidatus Hydrogenedens sp.]|nr:glycosyl hydrolase family 28 protein [Candidatus Hydrogenedens sp.]HOL20522.1 glycosyl hydrolase family 28 protein [Candidatus Hydrogenedens sp.]
MPKLLCMILSFSISFLIITSIAFSLEGQTNSLNVLDFGAVGDGKNLETVSIQKAIDIASEQKKALIFPAGIYLTGSLHLRGNLHIQLSTGAVILGSKDRSDYNPFETLDFPNDADSETSFFHHSLLWGEDIENILITGAGVIDSNFTKRVGPKALAFKRCKNIRIEGITIRNCPNYSISLLGCEQVTIDKVQILNGYADGIDPDSCQFVFISNCRIETVDDAIVPKSSFSLGYHRPCTDITITNCYLSTRCNGFKLGTESGSDFKRITFSNSVIRGLYTAQKPAISGVAIESVDGANIEGISVTGIIIDWARSPIFIRLGNRGRDGATSAGSIKGVTISNIVATHVSNPNIIAGIPEHPVEDVLIQNVFCSFDGSNPLRPTDEQVPEEIDRYPEALMFEALPCYAFFIRHARGVQMQNISFEARPSFWRITTDKYRDIIWNEKAEPTNLFEMASPGIAIWADDVQEFTLSDWREKTKLDDSVVIFLKDVERAQIETPIYIQNNPLWCIVKGGNVDTIQFKGQGTTQRDKNIKMVE